MRVILSSSSNTTWTLLPKPTGSSTWDRRAAMVVDAWLAKARLPKSRAASARILRSSWHHCWVVSLTKGNQHPTARSPVSGPTSHNQTYDRTLDSGERYCSRPIAAYVSTEFSRTGGRERPCHSKFACTTDADRCHRQRTIPPDHCLDCRQGISPS